MTVNLWGYLISKITIDRLLCELKVRSSEFVRVVTLNPQMIVAAFYDIRKKEWLKKADYILPDGHGITWALKREQQIELPVQTGVAFVTSILKSGEFSVYCLGGAFHTEEILKEMLAKNYPDVIVLGVHHGFQTDEELERIYKDIEKKQPDIIFIGMGYPKQESVIYDLSQRCKRGCAVGVGGVFDVLSGQKKLAPLWIRSLRVEWLYRGFQEPKRMLKWGYLVRYVYLVISNKLRK